ncbi:glycosyltransferase family 1 protein [Conexibacter sp. SYSU D00693]|uniref:glycosyltransferase family 4 protein n=1 Tax=Conexibacter sp. SYSU D00693 TaxID=2812560 RepID=UPI00196B6EDD|nr:glycosyltransferase family 1 protein [Conexibacter sp. SYSU D00693]
MSLVAAIDARAAAEVPAGRGRYVRELLRALAALPEAADARFVLLARERWEDPALDARFSWSLIGLPDPAWHAVAAVRASRAADVVLSTNSYLTAWGTWKPTAIYVHDLISLVEPGWAQPRAGRIERATIRPALRRAAALPCNSQATLDDLVRLFPAVASKASVIPLAADPPRGAVGLEPGEVAARHGLRERQFVLAAGTLEPRKNLERLIAAWAALPDDVRAGKALALVGPTGWDAGPILDAARANPDEVKLLGFVSDDELRALYAGCAAFAYPSLYEGFGLPVLEAMAAGAPVLTSSISSLPEVAQDAALLVEPHHVLAITEALRRLLTEPRLADRLRDLGPQRAAAYSWERTAREHLTLLRALARG